MPPQRVSAAWVARAPIHCLCSSLAAGPGSSGRLRISAARRPLTVKVPSTSPSDSYPRIVLVLYVHGYAPMYFLVLLLTT